ncbi:MAG: nitronate monooxygenase, partial [Bacteroidetes bacterium]|nr:nitronate monooxygenase [Bacteroidota bacterium]
DTELRLKSLTPVRLLKNSFYQQVKQAEEANASQEELRAILGKGRAKKGMFEGELEEGELEIGQVASQIREIKPAAAILKEIWEEFLFEKERLASL